VGVRGGRGDELGSEKERIPTDGIVRIPKVIYKYSCGTVCVRAKSNMRRKVFANALPYNIVYIRTYVNTDDEGLTKIAINKRHAIETEKKIRKTSETRSSSSVVRCLGGRKTEKFLSASPPFPITTVNFRRFIAVIDPNG